MVVPRVNDEYVTVITGTTVFGTLAMLLANDVDPEGGLLEVVQIGSTTHGTLSQDPAGILIYTPAPGYTGTDEFTYLVRDERGQLSQGTVHLTIVAAADAPVVQDELVSVVAGTPVSGHENDLLANDVDPLDGPLKIVSIGEAQHGALTRDTSGQLTYVAAKDFVGQEVIRYTVENAQGLRTEGKLIINVTAPVNSAPVVQDEWITIEAGTTVTGTVDQLLANDMDPDGDPLKLELGSVSGSGDLTQLDDGRIQFTAPSPFFFSNETSFSYTVSDSKGGSASARVYIRIVDSTNTAPTVQDDVLHVYTGQTVRAYVLQNDSDVNEDRFVIADVSRPSIGTAINGSSIAGFNGLWVDYYAPTTTVERTITGFNYTVTDLRGGTSEAWCQVIIDPRPANPIALLAISDTGSSDQDGITANQRPKLQLPADAAIQDGLALIVNGVPVGFSWVDRSQRILQVDQPLPEGECQIAYGYPRDLVGAPVIISPTLTLYIDAVAEPPTQSPTLLPEFDDGGQGSVLIIGQSARPVFDIGRLGPDETARLYVDGKLVASSYDAATGQVQMDQAFGSNLPNQACQDHQVAWTRVNQHGVESTLSGSTVVGVVASWLPDRLDLLDRDDSGISNIDGLTRVSTPRFFVGHPELPQGYSLSLMVDGQVVASQWDAASGLIQASNPLSDGEHQIMVGAVSGNDFMPMIYSQRLTIDTKDPVQFPLDPLRLDAASDLGYQGDNLTCINAPAMFHPELIVNGWGHTRDYASAQLLVDGVAVASLWDKQKGTLTPVNPLNDGRHTFNFYVSDAAGNNGPKARGDLDVTIDTRVPDLPPLKPDLTASDDRGPQSWIAHTADGSSERTFWSDDITNEMWPEFKVTYSPDTVAELLIDGKRVESTITRTGYDSYISSRDPLQEGWHDVAVRYRSTSGALSEASESLRILIDITRPDAPVSAPALRAIDDDGVRSDDGITSIKQPEFVFASPPADHFVALWIDGGPVASQLSVDGRTVKPNQELSLGQHEVAISYFDLAGNESARSKAVSISIVEPLALNDLLQDTSLFGQADTSTQLDTGATQSQSSQELLSFSAADRVHLWRGVEDAVWLAA
ncbi:tandem-95 repeat protein [Ideonella paludis]|uniref:Tandem-95 repeat protein n=2 Tax=Ideonella paludis TaxID=1233411 RepID=A0ABS5DWG7_9BURK|nr:tandem-95 repeat protein [Ideonella paludis]